MRRFLHRWGFVAVALVMSLAIMLPEAARGEDGSRPIVQPPATNAAGQSFGSSITCANGRSQCQTSRSLFACTYEQARQIAAIVLGKDAKLPFIEDCKVVKPNTPFDVEATPDAGVVLAKAGTRYIGYVPAGVPIEQVAIGRFPADLIGVWLGAEVNCKEYRADNTKYDDSDVLKISESELYTAGMTARALSTQQIGRNAWSVVLHFYGAGHEDLSRVRFERVGSTLHQEMRGSSFESIRCGDDQVAQATAPRAADLPVEGLGRVIACPTGSNQCRTVQSLFACNLETAASLRQKGIEQALYLVSTNACSTLPAGEEIEVEKTASPSVVYVTKRKVHVGYVPIDVTVPPEAFGQFPRALLGVWMPSQQACREYVRNGIRDDTDGSGYSEFRHTEWLGYESVGRLLLISPAGPQSWHVVLHNKVDAGEWLYSTTLKLNNDVLFSTEGSSTSVRCAGAPTLAERERADEIRSFKPLRLRRPIVTLGRCRMGECSWAKWLAVEPIDQRDGELVLAVTILWGTSIEEGPRKGRLVWNRSPDSFQVLCSKRRPGLISGKEQTSLTLSPSQPVSGVFEEYTRAYYTACHSDLRPGSEKAADYGYNVRDAE